MPSPDENHGLSRQRGFCEWLPSLRTEITTKHLRFSGHTLSPHCHYYVTPWTDVSTKFSLFDKTPLADPGKKRVKPIGNNFIYRPLAAPLYQ
jgi:hypothetical protein